MAANLLESHPPSYPRLASLTRIQGLVVLQAIVSKRGTVESVHVVKGPYLLRGAASNAVLSWRYKPYVLNGKPVEIATIVTVDFTLKPMR
jgi:protein TonB